MAYEDFISRVWMIIIFFSIGLAGLFGQVLWSIVMPFFIGGAIGVSYAFFKRWVGWK